VGAVLGLKGWGVRASAWRKRCELGCVGVGVVFFVGAAFLLIGGLVVVV
jgi:hypothetical protein